jgi:hypothetical protein
VPQAAGHLSRQVGENYIVELDENVYVHELAEEGQAPTTVELPAVDLESDSCIEIRDRWTRKLITIIELLSPSNKNPGPDRDQYLAKWRGILRSRRTSSRLISSAAVPACRRLKPRRRIIASC